MTHTYSKKEEIANAITHGIGSLLSIAGLVLLIVFALHKGTAWHVVSFSVYGTSMVLLYASSTLLHSLPKGKAKDVFEVLDHSFIYVFIAGTYTPILLNVVQGKLGFIILAVIWAIAIMGIVFKAFFTKKFLVTSTLLYIGMGWIVVLLWEPIITNLPQTGLALLVAGGLFYTLGTIFYIWRSFPYHHAVWHLFVLAGSILHFFMVLYYILP